MPLPLRVVPATHPNGNLPHTLLRARRQRPRRRGHTAEQRDELAAFH
jgi:hypothetical protein